MKIFDGFVRNYHTLNLSYSHGNNSFTMADINYFARLGSMLGFWAFTEDTADGSNNPMDLTWWDDLVDKGDITEWETFVLHLEKENLYKKDKETLNKLFKYNIELNPQNVIGIVNVLNKERIEQLLKYAKKICKHENALLIFRMGNEVYAYLLRQNKIALSKRAYISDISGTLFMYYEEEADSCVNLPHIKNAANNIFTRNNLLEDEFEGFITVNDLRTGKINKVPNESGVYLVLREEESPPVFLNKNPGGRFKGKDPTVDKQTLLSNWVEGTRVIYIGKGNNLNRRIREFIDFGNGSPIGHWGGRLVWQVKGSNRFVIAWQTSKNEKDLEQELFDSFQSLYHKLPFANLRR